MNNDVYVSFDITLGLIFLYVADERMAFSTFVNLETAQELERLFKEAETNRQNDESPYVTFTVQDDPSPSVAVTVTASPRLYGLMVHRGSVTASCKFTPDEWKRFRSAFKNGIERLQQFRNERVRHQN